MINFCGSRQQLQFNIDSENQLFHNATTGLLQSPYKCKYAFIPLFYLGSSPRSVCSPLLCWWQVRLWLDGCSSFWRTSSAETTACRRSSASTPFIRPSSAPTGDATVFTTESLHMKRGRKVVTSSRKLSSPGNLSRGRVRSNLSYVSTLNVPSGICPGVGGKLPGGRVRPVLSDDNFPEGELIHGLRWSILIKRADWGLFLFRQPATVIFTLLWVGLKIFTVLFFFGYDFCQVTFLVHIDRWRCAYYSTQSTDYKNTFTNNHYCCQF